VHILHGFPWLHHSGQGASFKSSIALSQASSNSLVILVSLDFDSIFPSDALSLALLLKCYFLKKFQKRLLIPSHLTGAFGCRILAAKYRHGDGY
jgi:hypothetical protein